MQNLKAPKEGMIYVSEADPTLKILVELVQLTPADGDIPAGFYVEGCNPDDADDMTGCGYEFLDDEWTSHRFTPL